MRLIKLEANIPSFKTVNFNEKGTTLIVGKKSDPESNDRTKTYNGVGKSLLVRLLHFCLGSNKIVQFTDKLADWKFTLTFKIDDEFFEVTRDTIAQDEVILNGQEYGLSDYRKKLLELCFEEVPISNVTFRSLINRFIRPNKASYNNVLSPNHDENDFTQLMNNAFLLGLDTELVSRKKDKKKEKIETITKKDNFKKDEILKEFFSGNKDPEIELIDLEDAISKLEGSIKVFDVAEDFHEIRAVADEASQKLRDTENQIFLAESVVSNIDKTLKIKSDLDVEQVKESYFEAKAKLNDSIIKELDEVVKFHKELIYKRKNRLLDEKKSLKTKIVKLNKKRQEYGATLDSSLKYLNSHRALDEFVLLNNKLSDLITRSQRIRDYRSMMVQYEAKIQKLNLEMTADTIKTDEYLQSSQYLITKINSQFRTLAKEFYSDRPGGISIKNNTGDNQTRFDCHVKIQDDASDGINEVKIFCYDMTILLLANNHKMKFLFHDSRLFSDIDSRQVATIFKEVHKIGQEKNIQYIASINQNQLEVLQSELNSEDYKKIIESAVALELTDESAESKLLGIQIDLDNE